MKLGTLKKGYGMSLQVGYSRLQKVGTWMIYAGFRSFCGFGVGGRACSNFPASTVCCSTMMELGPSMQAPESGIWM